VPDAETPALSAHKLALSSRRQRVFSAVSFEAERGSLVAILGPAGSGRTALLLTLSGRMRGWTGRALVRGIDAAHHPSRVRREVGLGLIAGINDLAQALTPAQHVAEQHAFISRRERSAGDVLARTALDSVADVQVKYLDAEQRIRLGIALALVRDVSVLVVDDLDATLDAEERARVLQLLRALSTDGLTVVFACLEQSTADFADLIVPLDRMASWQEASAYAVR
jgi:ABC-type multidrug transport system ATPase subunit